MFNAQQGLWLTSDADDPFACMLAARRGRRLPSAASHALQRSRCFLAATGPRRGR